MEKQELDLDNTATDDFFETVDVETLAKQQGVGPVDFARARRLGRFWPQDESIDDFVATVRRWRIGNVSEVEIVASGDDALGPH